MKLVKCKKCNNAIQNNVCTACGSIFLSPEEQKRYDLLTSRADIVYDFYEIVRHRVPKNEKRNVYLDMGLHKKHVDSIQKKIKVGTKWIHANGNVWLVKEVSPSSVGIIIIDMDGIEDGDSFRRLPIAVFAQTIRNNYYSQTRINKRIIGSDIAPLRTRDLFIRL